MSQSKIGLGTFRSCMTLWKQLFIIMTEIRGVFIPIAFAWLPDKTTASYYACLFLIMSAFCEHSDEINQIYGRSSFALRKIKCDFEVGIHLGWQMFRISGCYFHYTQVTTKLMFFSLHFTLKGHLEKGAGAWSSPCLHEWDWSTKLH